MDIALQLTEQGRMKGNRPFLAFLYEELLRKSWARRAEKGDPALDIAAEAQRVDKDLVDIARHCLSEVLKESGLSAGQRDHHGFGLTKTSPGEMVSRQLAAAEAAQKQAERVSSNSEPAQRRTTEAEGQPTEKLRAGWQCRCDPSVFGGVASIVADFASSLFSGMLWYWSSDNASAG